MASFPSNVEFRTLIASGSWLLAALALTRELFLFVFLFVFLSFFLCLNPIPRPLKPKLVSISSSVLSVPSVVK
jgi:hypothetical protein